MGFLRLLGRALQGMRRRVVALLLDLGCIQSGVLCFLIVVVLDDGPIGLVHSSRFGGCNGWA
jgi:hypothetical protein